MRTIAAIIASAFFYCGLFAEPLPDFFKKRAEQAHQKPRIPRPQSREQRIAMAINGEQRRVMDRIQHDWRRFQQTAYLGVVCLSLTSKECAQYRIPSGVDVICVGGETSAAKAEIIRGDLLVRFEGQPILHHLDLMERVEAMAIGSKVKLEGFRGNSPFVKFITLEPRPGSPWHSGIGYDPSSMDEKDRQKEQLEERFKIEETKMNNEKERAGTLDERLEIESRWQKFVKQWQDDMNQFWDRSFPILGVELTPYSREPQVQSSLKGAAISKISPNSPAERFGLAVGDFIFEADGRPIGCQEDLDEMLDKRWAGERMKFEGLRKGQPFTVWAILDPYYLK